MKNKNLFFCPLPLKSTESKLKYNNWVLLNMHLALGKFAKKQRVHVGLKQEYALRLKAKAKP